MAKLDSFDSSALQLSESELTEKMAAFNKCFKSSVAPDNGYFGLSRNSSGYEAACALKELDSRRTFSGLRFDGQINSFFKNPDQLRLTKKYFDDNGLLYCREISVEASPQSRTKLYILTPDSVVQKGNFTCVIDSCGRPVYNMMRDVQIRPKEQGRSRLGGEFRGPEYKVGDQRGHIIADGLGGPAMKENIVAQFSKTNQKDFAKVENLVRKFKSQGHTVDYGMKTNYIGTNLRPTSFEPIIRIDGGSENQVPAEMRKIYNSKVENPVKALVIDAGERFGGAHEVGVKSGLVSAGLAFSVSTAENLAAYVDGEISAEDMVAGIAGDTALAGVVGYGTTAAGAAISSAMAKSSESLIGKIGNSCLPASLVSFGVVSYNDVAKFVNGETDAADLAYGLGSNAAGIAGSVAGGIAGTAAVGAAVGSTVGPVGTLAGTVVGGAIGCAVATGVYSKAVELGSEGAEVVADQANRFAEKTLEAVKEIDASSFEPAKAAVQEYFESWNLPFSFGEDKE